MWLTPHRRLVSASEGHSPTGQLSEGQTTATALEVKRRHENGIDAVRREGGGSPRRRRPFQVRRRPEHAEGLLRQVLLREVVLPARRRHRAASGAPARPPAASAAADAAAACAGGHAGDATATGADAAWPPERRRGPDILLAG